MWGGTLSALPLSIKASVALTAPYEGLQSAASAGGSLDQQPGKKLMSEERQNLAAAAVSRAICW